MKPEPLLQDYCVCLVVPQIGLNAAQLTEVITRVKRAVSLLPLGLRLRMFVPTYDEDQPTTYLQPEVLNLARLGTAVLPHGVDPRRGGAAAAIVHAAEFEWQCDEVWCCPESTNRRARANQVYRLGQCGRLAPRYKMIPPWVEPSGVTKPAVKQMKKERPW